MTLPASLCPAAGSEDFGTAAVFHDRAERNKERTLSHIRRDTAYGIGEVAGFFGIRPIFQLRATEVVIPGKQRRRAKLGGGQAFGTGRHNLCYKVHRDLLQV